jgi:hypothetical protein
MNVNDQVYDILDFFDLVRTECVLSRCQHVNIFYVRVWEFVESVSRVTFWLLHCGN